MNFVLFPVFTIQLIKIGGFTGDSTGIVKSKKNKVKTRHFVSWNIEAIARNMIYNDVFNFVIQDSIILSQILICSELNGNNGFKFKRLRFYKNNFSLSRKFQSGLSLFVDGIS